MIIIRSRFLKTGEVWFDDEPTGEKVDVLLFRQRSTPIPGISCVPFYTILIDLTKDTETLFSEINKACRQFIRRAERDGVQYEYWDTNCENILPRFEQFYNEFAKNKGLPPANQRHLQALADAGRLALSLTQSQTGEEFVWHAYVKGTDRVRGLLGASLRTTKDSAKKNFIGRANRFHFWKDIVTFKMQGFSTFDFGGWYEGNTDTEKIGINKFKEEFGGTIVKEFNCEKLLTWKAKLVHAVTKYYHKRS